MKHFIVENQKQGSTDGYFAVVVKGETHLNRTVIKSDLQFYTTQNGYDYCHPWQKAKEYAEAIADGLNNMIKQKKIKEAAKRGIHYCSICGDNVVDAENGYDTCQVCMLTI